MKISRTNPTLFSQFEFGRSLNMKCLILLISSGKVSFSEKVQIATINVHYIFFVWFYMISLFRLQLLGKLLV